MNGGVGRDSDESDTQRRQRLIFFEGTTQGEGLAAFKLIIQSFFILVHKNNAGVISAPCSWTQQQQQDPVNPSTYELKCSKGQLKSSTGAERRHSLQTISFTNNPTTRQKKPGFRGGGPDPGQGRPEKPMFSSRVTVRPSVHTTVAFTDTHSPSDILSPSIALQGGVQTLCESFQ